LLLAVAQVALDCEARTTEGRAVSPLGVSSTHGALVVDVFVVDLQTTS
jgi:hypothetical protein